jgi:hypothetical protein
LAYTAKRVEKWTIVVDAAESPAYDEIVGSPRPIAWAAIPSTSSCGEEQSI